MYEFVLGNSYCLSVIGYQNIESMACHTQRAITLQYEIRWQPYLGML